MGGQHFSKAVSRIPLTPLLVCPHGEKWLRLIVATGGFTLFSTRLQQLIIENI